MFEVSRFEKVFTFQNVLLHETIQSFPEPTDHSKAMTDYLRLTIGAVVTKEDLVAMRYILRFVLYEGLVPKEARQYVKDSHACFVLMCWDILRKNEYNYEHPLARLARKFVENYQAHFKQLSIVEDCVDQLGDDVFGLVPIGDLGKFELEEAMRGLGIVINNRVFFPCAKRTENFTFLTNTEGKPTGSILIQKNNNVSAVLIMDFS